MEKNWRLDLKPGVVVWVVVLTVLLAWMIENFVVSTWSLRPQRLTSSFSPAFLEQRLRHLQRVPPRILMLGDSVLWGYRIAPPELASTFLRQDGWDCENLAFKGSSPPNYYALLRLFDVYHIRPKLVILEINQKVFNPADNAYNVLHPALEAMALPLLSADERAHLRIKGKPTSRLPYDAPLSKLWTAYAMRADIRETIQPVEDPAPPVHPDPDMFAGAFDLSPLEAKNTGVYFLRKTMDLLAESHIPSLVLFTPTNHQLLHDYIDSPEYEARNLYLQRVVQRPGVTVVNLDHAFAGNLFMDEVHLVPQGQKKLADILAQSLKEHQL